MQKGSLKVLKMGLIHFKEVVKPGLEFENNRFIDVKVENTGRGTFDINKRLQATKGFTGATIFNP